MRKITALFITAALTACGGGANPDKVPKENVQAIGNSTYTEIEAGRWLMTETIKSVNTGANFEVGFSLAEGGSLTLHAFANASLQEGFDIKFMRQGDSLSVIASVGAEFQNWSSYFTAVDASQKMTFTLDIHNNERPAHILIWAGSKNTSLNHRNTLYNTAEDSVDLGFSDSPGNGGSRQWGLSFTHADVHRAILSDPQETHE